MSERSLTREERVAIGSILHNLCYSLDYLVEAIANMQGDIARGSLKVGASSYSNKALERALGLINSTKTRIDILGSRLEQ